MTTVSDIKPTEIIKLVDSQQLLRATLDAITTHAVDAILQMLPIVPEGQYRFNEKDPAATWQSGKLHWYPVGGLLGNQANIKHAGSPENPIGERTVNMFEALIELERQKELERDPNAPEPTSPRDAVRRYFDLPPLDELPEYTEQIRGMSADRYASTVAKRISVTLKQQARGKDYTIIVEDDGIGQRADRMHETILSLGTSDKPNKPYLIGMFGQGGSSALHASVDSWFLSRRAPEVRDHAGGGVGWTIARRFMLPGRRGFVYWAYLAAHPDGRVAMLPESAADAADFHRGTRIGHVGYKFATSDQAYRLYNSLNHLLFNPILPYYVITKKDGRGDRMMGNGYRLSDLPMSPADKKKKDADIRLKDIPV